MATISSPETAIKTRRWPDLSMYGMRLVSVKLPTGEWRLLMMGGDKFPTQVQRLGFRKQGGVWLKGNANITMDELRAHFKRVQVHAALPETDIYRVMTPKNQPNLNTSEVTQDTQEEIDANLATKTATPIGINHLGQEVFIGPDGRFIRSGDGKVVTMTERGMTPAMFLRAVDDSDLELCADAMVMQIMEGVVYRDEDLELFATRIFDKDLEACAPDMPGFHQAINHALARRMLSDSKDTGRNAYNLALKLHEGLPPLTQELSEKIVTLPVGVVAQRLAGFAPGKLIYVPTIANGAMLSSAPDDTNVITNEVFDLSSTVLNPSFSIRSLDTNFGEVHPMHDISIVNFPHEIAEQELNILGSKVSRLDHASVMNMMNSRATDGRSVILLKAGKKSGEIDFDTKRLLTWISARNNIEGFIELDGSLFGAGGSANNRYMVVVGAAGQSDVIDFDATRVIYDHDALWEWSDHFISEAQRKKELPTRIENSYQSPYISASRVAKPSTMIPRNLVGPIREALAKTEQEFGPIDEFVSREIAMPIHEMATCFSPEQVDAIGLSIAAHKHGKGFINADQTGMGKGRALVGAARYAAINNLQVIFLSEKKNLFADFYRDILDTNSEQILRPWVLNANSPIVLEGVKHHPVTPREEIALALETKTIPQGATVMMATYTQFNRDNRRNGDLKSEFLKEVSKDAFVVMDESHNAAGESNVGYNVLRSLRNISGVVYSSATYAKDSANFRIYSKALPPSVSPNSIGAILKKGGDPLAEVFSSMLAEDAVMIRREHDLSKTRFETSVDDIYAARNEDLANKFAEILEGMGIMLGEVETVINQKNSLIFQDYLKRVDRLRAAHVPINKKDKFKPPKFNSRDMGWFGNNFGSSLYSVMRQFFLALKTDFAADLAIKALNEGRKPVIALENTNEALLKDVVQRSQDADDAFANAVLVSETDAEDEESDENAFAELMNEMAGDEPTVDEATGDIVLDVPVTFRDILHRMLDKMDRVNVVKKGKVEKQERIETQSLERFKRSVEMKIDAFPDLYLSPIDIIKQKIEDAGYTCSEISGRKIGVMTRPDGSQIVYNVRSGNRNRIIDQFNSGVTDAIVLTPAGSTGISLHAGEKFKDQRQRELIEAQIANNVATRLQIFGRVGRKGQVCWPIIRSLDSGLPAETRFISMQNAKLREMSANTTSNRDNSILDGDMMDLLNPLGSEICRKFMLENSHIAKRLLIDVKDLTEEEALKKDKIWYANQLTGRLGMLYVNEQRDIYEQISSAFGEEIDALNALGQNPFKPNEMDVKAQIKNREEIYTPVIVTGSVFDTPVFQTEIVYDRFIETYTLDDIEGYIKEHEEKFFYLEPSYDHMQRTVDSLVSKKQMLLENAWIPKLHDTLELALEDEDSTAFALNRRIEFILKWAPSLVTRNGLQFTDAFGNIMQGYIMAIDHVPTKKQDYLGQYNFKLYIPGEGSQWMTLYRMYKDENFNIFTDVTELKDEIKNKNVKKIREVRQVLEGNIFAACAWSSEHKKGVSSIYTNDLGERCRGVVMPREAMHVNMDGPFPVDVEVAKAYMKDMYYSGIKVNSGSKRSYAHIEFATSNNLQIKQIHMSATTDDKGITSFKLHLPKVRESIQFIDATFIPAIRAEQFKLIKGQREGYKTIPVDITDLDQLIEEIYDGNMTLFMPLDRKDEVLDVYNALNAAKNKASHANIP